MARDRRSKSIYVWILVLVGMAMVMPLAGWMWGRAYGDAPTPTPLAARKMTEADLDAGLLLKLQDQLVSAQVARTREALRAEGMNEDIAPPRVSSTYLTSNGHKFGVVRSTLARDEAELQLVLVVGVVDGSLKRVVCLSGHGEVPLSSGRCAEKLADVFGTVL
jgi:hypothetical protein